MLTNLSFKALYCLKRFSSAKDLSQTIYALSSGINTAISVFIDLKKIIRISGPDAK